MEPKSMLKEQTRRIFRWQWNTLLVKALTRRVYCCNPEPAIIQRITAVDSRYLPGSLTLHLLRYLYGIPLQNCTLVCIILQAQLSELVLWLLLISNDCFTSQTGTDRLRRNRTQYVSPKTMYNKSSLVLSWLPHSCRQSAIARFKFS